MDNKTTKNVYRILQFITSVTALSKLSQNTVTIKVSLFMPLSLLGSSLT